MLSQWQNRLLCRFSAYRKRAPPTAHAGPGLWHSRDFPCRTEQTPAGYCSFAYSALASFSMGMSGSASFQRAKKSW